MGTESESPKPTTEGFRLPVVLAAGGLVVSLVVLAVSGVVLASTYRPGPQRLWQRDLHRVAAVAALWLALLVAVLLVVRWLLTRHDRPQLAESAVIGVVAAVVVGFAGFTGYLLPWDHLALWAMPTTTTNFRGIDDAAFSRSVRFVLIGSSEVGQSTYRIWAIVHTAALPAVLLGLAGWATVRRLRRPTG